MNYLEGAEKYYDLFGEKDDVEFYVEQAKLYNGKALELGVGTARLAINLAKAGVETRGIDTSRYMLNAAKANISKLDSETRSRLHLEQGNAVDFKLLERFNMIYFPSCSFDHILDPLDQRKALQNIKDHLAPAGVYVFDLYLVPEIKPDKDWFVQRKELDATSYVVRSGYHTIDPETRLMTLNMWYEVYENGRMIERYHEGSQVYIHDAEGVRKLLRETGYRILHEYGDHHGKKYEKGDNIIVLVAQPE
ncbi:MAG: class I SAM-dependent methyltransferase [Candidatus Bathyarchaeota archaeon]|nr:class I SAM-dependent methyltransferase [Candidatus Bathyarchaeota archaeon]